eukprot:Gb_04637 [translate_table: standard]
MKAMEYLWNWKRWHLILYLMFLCESVAVAAPLKTVHPKGHSCPLDFTRLKAHPWKFQQCTQSDTAHCCEAALDLIKILLFSHLQTHKLFLLPHNRTAAACLEAFQQHLRAKGVPKEVLAGCKSVPEYFVSHPQSCNGISNLSGFEAAVDPSALKRNCNGSQVGRGFNCQKCVRAMADARHQLQRKGSGKKSNCDLFVMTYLGGGINSYNDLGPNAAYCLLIVQNFEAVRIRHSKIALEIAIPPTLAILLLLGILVKWRRFYFVQGSRRIALLQRHQLLRESVDVNHGLVFFSLSEIRTSTGNFMDSNVIGEGGFSTVYRGTLSDGSPIAVKRFKDYTAKGDINFTHEVQVISSVRHRNLMPLKGYCIERNEEGSHEQLLVYDFMPNGSLADYLFKKDKPCLSWDERRKIAVGIARGLAYLHEDAKPAIIHRDVKAANVLLNADLNPLIADFGLAMFKPEESKTHYTTRAVGTPGYVAPEYALYGHLTYKSDVFSFGILLLELMSGRKALNSQNVEHLLISDWACDMLQRGMSETVIDHRIRESGPKESMERVILLGLQCAHPRVASRPSISKAQTILETIDRPLPDVISASPAELKESIKSRSALNWLVSPADTRERSSCGSTTIGTISMDSYGVR